MSRSERSTSTSVAPTVLEVSTGCVWLRVSEEIPLLRFLRLCSLNFSQSLPVEYKVPIMNAPRFALESLRYTMAVEREGSFSAAARSSGIAQPTLSNGVAKLEKQLGGEIFSRSPQGVSTTEFGEKILPLIENALKALDNVARTALQLTDPSTSSLRVGTTALVNPRVLDHLQKFAEDCVPPLQIILKEAPLPSLREHLQSGELDLILIPAIAPMKGFEHRIIDSEPMMLISPENKTSPRSTHTFEVQDLADSTVIFPPPESGLALFMQDLFTHNGLTVDPYPSEALSSTTLEKWATLGFGYAILPTSQVSPFCEQATPLVEEGQEVEFFHEAVWSNSSPFASVIATALSDIHQQLPTNRYSFL